MLSGKQVTARLFHCRRYYPISIRMDFRDNHGLADEITIVTLQNLLLESCSIWTFCCWVKGFLLRSGEIQHAD